MTKEIVMILPENNLVRFDALLVGELFEYQGLPFVKTSKTLSGHDVNAQRILGIGEVAADTRHGSIFSADHKVREITRAVFEVKA